MLAGAISRPAPCQRPLSVRAAHRGSRSRAFVPQSALILVPTGDGSCAHLDKAVSLPDKVRLTDGLYEVGREKPADIVIPIPTISSRHAMIRVDGKSVNITDLNSTNGTYLDSEELPSMKAQEIPIGSEITFGDMFLAKFELQEE
ncbi:hypothetical protein WJX73_001580 [Symbiochloris irregularis]|uniref:FHA domain-containing protein n=1 Tax=Symbiochloris irregularis TaxID=706552 RepID=A0AAW1NNE7_9CHLO